MTTIILTIIGILLAAAAALMVIFYGGDAFNSGTVGAQANQLQNGGTNVVSAVQMFKAETASAPTSFAQLTTAGPNGAYLDELPALATGQTPALVNQTGVDPDGAGPLQAPIRQLYTVTGVPAQVCARINTNLRVPAPTNLAGAVAGAKMACIPGADADEDPGTFYARAYSVHLNSPEG